MRLPNEAEAVTIIARAPLRVSLGGGGTDLPEYAHKYGGFTISAAIDKYVYVAANHTFTDDYVVHWKEHEVAKTPDDIQHPIFREALKLYEVPPGVELITWADVPAGTGLDSSGSFTVALLRALGALKYRYKHTSDRMLAYEAYGIERHKLGRPVGKQDQFSAALGGLLSIEYRSTIDVIRPLSLTDETLQDLEDNLLLFFTGYARDADLMLEDQRQRADEQQMLNQLHAMKAWGIEAKQRLLEGGTGMFAWLMDTHWKMKRRRTDGMTNPRVDQLHELGMQNGAVGGKLVGAGAGGFLMFYARDHARLRKAMSDAGARELRFRFDHYGVSVTEHR